MSEKMDFLEKSLQQLDMVNWDRYIEWWDKEDNHWTKVYGWIGREKDEYKDFVVIQLNLSKENIFDYITSSARYDDEIHSKLGIDAEEDVKCKRVENLPIKSQSIELEHSS